MHPPFSFYDVLHAEPESNRTRPRHSCPALLPVFKRGRPSSCAFPLFTVPLECYGPQGFSIGELAHFGPAMIVGSFFCLSFCTLFVPPAPDSCEKRRTGSECALLGQPFELVFCSRRNTSRSERTPALRERLTLALFLSAHLSPSVALPPNGASIFHSRRRSPVLLQEYFLLLFLVRDDSDLRKWKSFDQLFLSGSSLSFGDGLHSSRHLFRMF